MILRHFIQVFGCSIVLANCVCAQTTLQFPRRDYAALAQQSSYWIGTPGGLYQYRSSENIWSVKYAQNGLPTSTVTRLAYDEETLWIGRDHGVTVFNLKSNVMLSYDSADGLPSGKVLSMAFETDYAWIGTMHGVARYDRLIEQWQTIDRRHGLAGEAAFAIGIRDGATWIFTEDAVNEYDTRYERWRWYRPDSATLDARDVLLTGNAAWIARDRDLLRFDYASRVFQRYAIPNFPGFEQIRHFVIDGNSFWIVTRDALWYYDAQNDSFRPFLDIANLPDRDIHAITLSSSGTAVSFATRTGISQYDRGSKTWKYYNEAGGLPRSDFETMFSAGSDLIGMTATEFVYLSNRDNRWYTYPLLATGSSGIATFSIDPAHGTHADFGSGIRLALSGTRASWLWKSDDLSVGSITSAALYDLKARLDLGSDRSISAGYNNADYSDVMYGAQYRGAKDDILQSLQVGDLRVEQGLRRFLPSFGIFGGGGRISLGARTERYHRAFLEVTAVEGHQTTAVTSEIFAGKTRRKVTSFRDVDYIRRQYYALPPDWKTGTEGSSLFVYRSLPSGSALIPFIDESTIAVMTARWEQLSPGKDYLIQVQPGNVLQLTAALPKGVMLAAIYRDMRRGINEVILADTDSSAYELVNRYFVRGTAIIPSSLRIRLRDAADRPLPTSQYGLGWMDTDVHEDLMDYRNGILRFGTARPFPSSVYADSAFSNITMTAEFETFNTSYILSNPGIVRGSESILVDGFPVKAGDDYVLDYTSGYLLFTRDGAVSDNSRIEVTYEYTAHDATDRYGQLSATCSPSDNVQAGVSAAHFTSAEGRKQVALSASADLRTQNDLFDLRILPEYARTISDSGSGNALGIQSWFSAGGFRINAGTRRQDGGFREKFARLFPMGRTRNESFAHSEFDVLRSLRLLGEWARRSGTDTAGNASKDERVTVGLQWVQNALPSVTVKAERLTEAADAFASTRRVVRGDMEYILPAEALGIVSGLVTSYVRFSDETAFTAGGASADFQFQNYYVRTLISPMSSFTINAYYRGDRLERNPTNSLSEYDVISTEKLFVDMVLESVRGLSLNSRYTLDQRGTQRPGVFNGFDSDRRSSIQASTRVSPGAYVSALTPFTVTASVQSDRSAYYFGQSADTQSLFLPLFNPQHGEQLSGAESVSLEGRLEWRPAAEFVYLITGRHTGTTARQFATSFTDTRNEVLQRFDYRMGSTGLYSAQLSVINGYNPWSHLTRFAPAIWVEQRWSPRLLTRFTLGGSIDNRVNGPVRARSRDVSPGINLTLTMPGLPVIRKAELRDDIAYSRGVQSSEISPGTFRDATSEGISNVVYLDLYPHPSSYIRIQYQARWNRATALSPYTFLNSGQVSIVMQL